jgi:hypothetical protein
MSMMEARIERPLQVYHVKRRRGVGARGAPPEAARPETAVRLRAVVERVWTLYYNVPHEHTHVQH